MIPIFYHILQKY